MGKAHQKLNELTAWALSGLLAFAILTLWIRDPRPLAIFQVSVLMLAALRLAIDRGAVLHPVLAPIGGMLCAGLLQLAAGRTAYRWETTGAVLNWATHLAIAWLALQTFGDARRRDWWLTRWAIFAIVLSAAALLQLFTTPGKVFWLFDSGYQDLVFGPFVYHNRYAQFVELLLPIVLYRAISDREHSQLWLLGGGVMFAGVIASVSRAGSALLIVEIVAVLVCAAAQGLLTRRTMWVAVGQVTGVAVVWGTIAGWSGIIERLVTLDLLADWRFGYYQSSFAMIRDHPLWGSGLSTWPVIYPQYALFDPGLFVNAAHSDWLQWTVEGGAPAALLMIGFVAALARGAVQSIWGIGVFTVLAHAMFDYPMQDAAFASLVFASAGIVAAERASFLRTRFKAVMVEGKSKLVKRVTVLPLLALLICLSAQAQNRPVSAISPMGDAGAANLPGQKIGPNDLIAISVYDAPEFTRTVRVSAEGLLALPMLSSGVRASGLLPAELEKAIAAKLSDEGILVKPVVMVTVAEYHSRPISVMGAVRKPVTLQAVGRITVLDALARAEGLSPDAGPEILLTRIRANANGEPVRDVTRIPVRELIDQAKPELNIVLTGDEEIRVPEAWKFYVVGNVKRPGAYAVKDAKTSTVLRALALAEGVGPFPQRVAYIYRAEPDGARREIAVELAKLIDRKTEDVTLLADDVLYIPENKGKKNAVAALEKASGFGLATASGVLIWRR